MVSGPPDLIHGVRDSVERMGQSSLVEEYRVVGGDGRDGVQPVFGRDEACQVGGRCFGFHPCSRGQGPHGQPRCMVLASDERRLFDIGYTNHHCLKHILMFTHVVKNINKNNASLSVLVEALALIMLFILDVAYHIRRDMTAGNKRADGEKLNKNFFAGNL